MTPPMTTNNTQADALVEHFPTGLRSTRHVLTATGEEFESPIQCDCHCGASFAGTDEQEVRELWAEHAIAALRPASTARPDVERIVAFIREQSDLGADYGLAAEKGTTRRAAYGGGSLALKRIADEIERQFLRPTATEASEG